MLTPAHGPAARSLCGACRVELLFTTLFEGNNQFVYFGTYAILIAVVLLGAAQVIFLNKGFAICPATVMVPIFFCFFSVFSMVLTICYFEQWTCFTPLQGGMVALGTIIILIGVALLSRPASVTAGLPPSRYARATTGHMPPHAGFSRALSKVEPPWQSAAHRCCWSTTTTTVWTAV